MKSLRKFIRIILKEEIGRNIRTINNDPIRFDRAANFDVDIYPDSYNDGWVCTIKSESNPELNDRERSFPTEDEAIHYSRNYIEKFKNHNQSESLTT